MRQPQEFDAIAARLNTEPLLSVAQAAKLVPSRGPNGTNPSTLVRWIIRGKRGVHLDGIMLSGDGWWTSRAALARFSAELTRRQVPGWDAEMKVAERPTSKDQDREKRAKAAREELRRIRAAGKR